MSVDDKSALVAEQLRHLVDLQQAKIDALSADLKHYRELTDRRLGGLEGDAADHEQRLRSVNDVVVQFKLYSGLASGGSSIMAIVALIKAFFSV
jgi:uncharacterized coiled-coil protein SlyX